jgi:hypothetical protein
MTRVGYGIGEQVADGDWEEARRAAAAHARAALAWRSRRRSASPRCCRGATSRSPARSSRCGRGSTSTRAASARPRCSCAPPWRRALAELAGWRDVGGIAGRLDELRGLQPGVEDAARAALQGGLEPEDAERVRAALGRLEAALRARSAAT